MIPGAFALAVLGWAITFSPEWGNFWIKIGVTVLCMTAYALVFGRPALRWSLRSVLLGIGSAAVLYGMFWAGNRFAPYIVPGAHGQVGGIYGAVHIFSGNIMLVAAALVAGLFWGGLYAWKKDLAALIVSHSVWSAAIFIIFPIR